MLKSFFVAFNRSPHALAALEVACFLAAPVRGKIHVGHIIEINHEPVISAGLLAGTIETMAVIPPVEAVHEVEAFRRESEAHARELFERAREVCVRWGVRCETACLRGYVEEEVVARGRVVDLVALGVALEAPRRRPAGALAESIVRASTQPVLLASAPFTRPSGLFILYDGSACTFRALSAGAEIAHHCALPLTLITAPTSREECEAIHQRACQYLGDWELKHESVVVRPREGVERELCALLGERPDALALMGACDESRLKQWLLGSATRPIVEHTANPVILFRH